MKSVFGFSLPFFCPNRHILQNANYIFDDEMVSSLTQQLDQGCHGADEILFVLFHVTAVDEMVSINKMSTRKLCIVYQEMKMSL